MAAISTLRGQVDITHLSGDTLRISVKAPTDAVEFMEWDAQVRTTTASDQIEAIFDIVPPAIPGDPAFLTLSAADTARLAPPGEQFSGVWDCQISPPGGGDQVTTLCGGKLTLKPDVTRMDTP